MNANQSKATAKRRRFNIVMTSILVVILAMCGVALTLLALAWVPMGKAPSGERLKRIETSQNYSDGAFVNTQPMYNDYTGWLDSESSEHAYPENPLPVITDTKERLKVPVQGTRVTWFGHSTLLFEIAGKRVLTDPVFGPSTAPIEPLGPQRWYPPVVPLEDLEPIDIVLISHDHYDHLDYKTVQQIGAWETTFIVPLGVGSHLEYWGIESQKIIELDWWEERSFDELRIAATPARHASGRGLTDQMETLWAGYALISPKHRLMFSGDTGLFDDMSKIGEKYGPFDLVMIEVGAYNKTWPDWHIGPEQAMRGHKMMRGKTFLPIHWGLFDLALHGWTEPIERTLIAAAAENVPVATPKPGQPFELDDMPTFEKWWPDVPFQTAEEHPIISTKNGDPNVRYE